MNQSGPKIRRAQKNELGLDNRKVECHGNKCSIAEDVIALESLK